MTDEQLVESEVARLIEHFDSVRIIVTKNSHEGTQMITRGDGNYYAQIGSVRDWIEAQNEETRIIVRKNTEE